MSVSPLAPDVNVNLPSQVLYKILLQQTPLSHGELSARATHSAADTSSLSSNLIRFHRVSNRAVNRNWRSFQNGAKYLSYKMAQASCCSRVIIWKPWTLIFQSIKSETSGTLIRLRHFVFFAILNYAIFCKQL